jgi:two-component system LytT family sensor kinase
MRTKKIRFFYMLIAGILIAFLINILVPFSSPDHIFINDVSASIIITMIIWEGSLRIDSWLNIKYPWVEHVPKRILIQFLITLVFSSFSVFFPMLMFNKFVCTLPIEKEAIMLVISISIGVLVSFLILTIEISAQFFNNWKASLVEVEKYKTESIQAQLKNLKEQVNPHFLFNNLSVLTSLVYKDQDKAAEFINQLAKVYRYVLEQNEHELVTLQKELNFIESYIFLLKIRFENSLQIEISIPENEKSKLIPPMCLQVLVENTIKHNELSIENPLQVRIYFENDYLVVSNNLQVRKNNEPASKTGIKNICSRYQHFTDRKAEIIETADAFTVKIPLLSLAL